MQRINIYFHLLKIPVQCLYGSIEKQRDCPLYMLHSEFILIGKVGYSLGYALDNLLNSSNSLFVNAALLTKTYLITLIIFLAFSQEWFDISCIREQLDEYILIKTYSSIFYNILPYFCQQGDIVSKEFILVWRRSNHQPIFTLRQICEAPCQPCHADSMYGRAKAIC